MTEPNPEPPPSSSAPPTASTAMTRTPSALDTSLAAQKARRPTWEIVLIAIGTVIGGFGVVAVAVIGLILYTCSAH